MEVQKTGFDFTMWEEPKVETTVTQETKEEVQEVQKQEEIKKEEPVKQEVKTEPPKETKETKVEPAKEETVETTEELEEEPTSVYEIWGKEFVNKGLFEELPEDFKGTEEEFFKLGEQSLNKKAQQLIKSDFENSPQAELAVELYNYIKEGKDLNVFLDVYSNPLAQINLENESDQEKVVFKNLKASTNLSDDRIREKIKLFKDSAILEEEAKDAFENLTILEQREKDYKKQQEDLRIKKAHEEALSAINEIQTYVKTNDTIAGVFDISTPKKKQDFLDFKFKKTERLPNGQLVSKSELMDINMTVDQHNFLEMLKYKNYKIDSLTEKVQKESKTKLAESLEKFTKTPKIKSSGKSVEANEIERENEAFKASIQQKDDEFTTLIKTIKNKGLV